MKPTADVLDHATSEITSPREIGRCRADQCKSRLVYFTGQGSRLSIDATKKIPGDGFKRPWPPLIKVDAAVKAKVEKLFGNVANRVSNPQ